MKQAWNRARDFFLKDLWLIDLRPFGRMRAASIQALRILVVLVNDMLSGPLTLWAMSLVYTTLLSLVPLLAVAFSLLKAFGVHNTIEPVLYNLLSPLGPKSIELTNRVIEFVNRMNVSVLGFLGLALLIYTVISVIQKMEDAFNAIWRVKNPRSLLRRFSDYLSVLVVGPVLIAAAIGLTASIMNTKLMRRLVSVEPVGTIIDYAGELVPYILVCTAFTFIYLLIPNTRVRVRSAAVGGIVGGFLWQSVGWGFASFIAGSTRYTAIYSGFAILILFMIWVYLSWLILLIGAEVSYYYQNPQSLSIRKDVCAADARLLEQLAVSIMFLVGFNFYHRKEPWTTATLGAQLGLTMKPLEEVISALERNRLIIDTVSDQPGYVPARDIGTITINDIVSAVRGRGPGGTEFLLRSMHPIGPVMEIMGTIDRALSEALGKKTLRDIVQAPLESPA